MLALAAVLGPPSSATASVPEVLVAEIIDSLGDGTGNALLGPGNLAVGSDGTLYVTGRSSNNAFAISQAGAITQIIDSSGDGNGTGLDFPIAVAVDAPGNVYVSSGFSTVFQIAPSGFVGLALTMTGDGSNPFQEANDMTLAGGVLYVAGFVSDNVFELTPGGAIQEIIDSSGDGSSPLDGANAVVVDAQGNVYVAGFHSDNVFRIAPDGSVTLILDATGDGVGTPLLEPESLAIDADGNLFVTGRAMDAVLRIQPDGSVDRIIGPEGDGLGNPLDAPTDVVVGAQGAVYVTGSKSDNVFVIRPNGDIQQLVDETGGGAGIPVDAPFGLAIAPDGDVFVANLFSDNVLRLTEGTRPPIRGTRLHDRLVDRNLIVNPDAEADIGQSSMASNIVVTGWDDPGALTTISYGSANFPSTSDPGPPNPGLNLFGAGVAASSVMSQQIDLSALACGIDEGLVSFSLDGWFGGLAGQADEIVLGLQFLDGDGDDRGGEITIGRTSLNSTGLFPKSSSGAVPPGSRTARLELRGTLRVGSFIDGYADNLSLILSAPACADALDNDGDGLVDVDDPKCLDDGSLGREVVLAADLGSLSPLDASRTIVDSVRGWEFSPTEAVVVTHLAWFDECDTGTGCGPDGLNASHEVGLYAVDGTLLRSAVVPAQDGSRLAGELADGAFHVEAIDPITLEAGARYVVAGTDPATPFDFAWSDSPRVAYDDRIVFLDYRQQLDRTALDFPGEVVPATSGHFGPNFSVPAPTAHQGCAAALFALLLARKLGCRPRERSENR